MKLQFFTIIFLIGAVFAVCPDFSERDCLNNENCAWEISAKKCITKDCAESYPTEWSCRQDDACKWENSKCISSSYKGPLAGAFEFYTWREMAVAKFRVSVFGAILKFFGLI